MSEFIKGTISTGLGAALVYLVFTLATMESVEAQATRVVCYSTFEGYKTFTGDCPWGWEFVGIADE
jgi:hypothetical protein